MTKYELGFVAWTVGILTGIVVASLPFWLGLAAYIAAITTIGLMEHGVTRWRSLGALRWNVYCEKHGPIASGLPTQQAAEDFRWFHNHYRHPNSAEALGESDQ